MMNLERRLFLERHIQEHLTLEEINQGYHFCLEWDGLLIGPEDPEAQCCTCERGDGTKYIQ